jgi:tRNA 2-thiouridine synthesizing protein A
MVNKMENKNEVKEVKISKRKMAFKMIRLFLWTIRKRKWFLPGLDEITADELFERMNSNLPPLLLDVRGEKEFNGGGEDKYEKYGHIPNATHVPIMELTANLEDLPKDKEIVTICPGGGMSLVAVDILVEAEFQDVKSLKGGIWAWQKKGYPLITTSEDIISPHEDIKPSAFEDRAKIIEGKQPLDEKSMSEVHHTLDVRNLICPIPVLKSKKKLKTMKIGQVLEILTTDPGSKRDIPAWAYVTGQELLVSEESGPKEFRFLVKRMK